ncbi:MAG TPA: hypothetical protein VE996_13350 [Terriglobales bacterium]|nr:hypothetical protein [Terriglobales bacterium]
MSEPALARGEQRRGVKIAALAVLLVAAGFVIWNETQDRGALLPRFTAAAGAGQDAAVHKLLAEPDPGLHLDYLARVRAIRYGGALRNLFQPAPVAPAPGDPARAGGASGANGGAVPAQPAGPAPPPPLPLKFYGYAVEGGAKRIFLQMGDDIYLVSQGELVAHRYRIVRIDKASVTVEDTADQRTEALPLIVG